mgnify:FL=1
MAPERGAVDHVLPVVGQAEFEKCLQQCVPHALFRPSPEADIDRVPLAISFMHVAPRATDPQHIQHAVGRQTLLDEGPLFVRRVASSHECLLKSLLESVDG